ncbi:MAG: winged helix-turn-helix domain-containing protein [Gemmatimonadales bacterium]
MAKHGTARDDRRPGVGELRTVRGKSDGVSQSSARADALDRLIHERLRLGIVSALAVNDSLSFSDLKKLMKTTDGNLSVHARKLEEAEYITCTKSFEGRMPKTEYKLTATGRRALERYLDHMEALIRATRER